MKVKTRCLKDCGMCEYRRGEWRRDGKAIGWQISEFLNSFIPEASNSYLAVLESCSTILFVGMLRVDCGMLPHIVNVFLFGVPTEFCGFLSKRFLHLEYSLHVALTCVCHNCTRCKDHRALQDISNASAGKDSRLLVPRRKLQISYRHVKAPLMRTLHLDLWWWWSNSEMY